MNAFQSIDTSRHFERVRAAIQGCTGWHGRIRPEAVAQALAIDMRRAGVNPDDDLALPAERIAVAARDLDRAFSGHGPSFLLPFGTRVTVGRPGSVEIAGRVYVWRPNAPGLHPIETTPRDATGATFESLRLSIASWSSATSASSFGRPLPGTMCDGRVRHVIDFPPLSELGGAVLQYDSDMIDAARFCSATVSSIEKFCKIFVKDAQWLWRHRARIAGRVEEVRAAAEAGIRATDPYGTAAVLGRIIIDGRSVRKGPMPTIRVEYSGYDDSLRRGRPFDVVAGYDIASAASMRRIPLVNMFRGTRIFRLNQRGADGRIDARAAAIAGAALEGDAAILRRLARNLETDLVIPSDDGDLHATLFWRDGVIRAEESDGGGLERLWRAVDWHGVRERWAHDQMVLPMELLAESGRAAERLPVVDGVRPDQSLGLSLVNTTTGAIWSDEDMTD